MAKAAAQPSRYKKPTTRKPRATKSKSPLKKSAAKTAGSKAAVRKTAAAKRPAKRAARAPKVIVQPRGQLGAKLFAVIGALLLFASVVFWAVLSARLQRYNADQLVDGYLFQNGATFHAASFPGAHTFLLKWPLFYVMQLFGDTVTTYMVVTVLLSLATIGALVAVLHKIERRPIVFGIWCLALASMLLMVPAQPTAGGLLPVNVAMITTRNLEYVLYLFSVYALIKARRLKSYWFVIAGLTAGLLIASDKLFAALYVGGAGLALLLWLIRRLRSPEVTGRPNAGLRWLVNGLAAFVVATAILKLITVSHLTHIVSQTTTSPYGVIHSGKQLVEALVYGVEAVFTNFGANPVQGQVVVRSIPGSLVSSFSHITIIAYLLNTVLLAAALWLSARLIWRNRNFETTDRSTRFVLVLLWSTLAAIVVFVATNHYYPVDSRYLTIELFGLISAAALQLSRQHLVLRQAVWATLLIAVCLPIAVIGSLRSYHQSNTVLAQTKQLDTFIGTTLQRNDITTVIGSYWTVTPLRTFSEQPITTIALSSCRQPLVALSSSQWLQVPNKGVAYVGLRSADGLYDGCSQAQLEAYYGQPSQRIIVSGTFTEPSEILWLYPNGLHHILKTPPATGLNVPIDAPVVVPPLAKTASCSQGSLMNVVAHEDDDLLFMNPDLLQAINAGECVTTVYLTAGDAGGGEGYALNRQAGAEAAYGEMYGLADNWQSEYATINDHEVGAAYLVGEPKLTLIFLHLPDGDMKGQGFAANNYESLYKLRTGQITVIHGVFGLVAYTRPELISTLTALMNLYQPNEIHTQNYSSNLADGDHSDHHATGYFTELAYANYTTPSVIKAYAGYPGRHLPVNVTGQAEDQKTAAFLAYAAFDGAVCHSIAQCEATPTYGGYLAREYSIVVGRHSAPASSTTGQLPAPSCPSLSEEQLKTCNLKS